MDALARLKYLNKAVMQVVNNPYQYKDFITGALVNEFDNWGDKELIEFVDD